MDFSTTCHFGGYEVPNAPFETARVVVLPLCYEHAPSYGTGSAEGPGHILEASAQLERLDEESLRDWGEIPIHTLAPPALAPAPAEAVAQMKTAAARVLAEDKFLLCLGGDHAVSIGPIMAAAEKFGSLGVLQIDAHADLRNEWNGSRYNHACVMRRVIDDMNLPAVQVGIRSLSREEGRFLTARGLTPFWAHRIDPADDAWMASAVAALPEHVYLTVDLDGLDPSLVPGTGTPEPGGLTYRQVTGLIRRLGAARRVIGADITELAKIDGTQVSEYTAARIAAKIILGCAAPV